MCGSQVAPFLWQWDGFSCRDAHAVSYTHLTGSRASGSPAMWYWSRAHAVFIWSEPLKCFSTVPCSSDARLQAICLPASGPTD